MEGKTESLEVQGPDKQAVALFKIIPYCHMKIGKATLCKLIYIKVVIKLVVEYVLLLPPCVCSIVRYNQRLHGEHSTCIDIVLQCTTYALSFTTSPHTYNNFVCNWFVYLNTW